jgi:Skp family chaperone for outer membrane proteins
MDNIPFREWIKELEEAKENLQSNEVEIRDTVGKLQSIRDEYSSYTVTKKHITMDFIKMSSLLLKEDKEDNRLKDKENEELVIDSLDRIIEEFAEEDEYINNRTGE